MIDAWDDAVVRTFMRSEDGAKRSKRRQIVRREPPVEFPPTLLALTDDVIE